MRAHKAVTVLAGLTVLVAGCSLAGAPTSASGRSKSVDGIWRSVGYGWVISVRMGRAQWFETTAVSCLPGDTLRQIGVPGPHGTVRFGDKHGGEQARMRRVGGERGVLRLTGDVADVDLVALPHLPPACSHEMPDDPLTTFDVFWSTFAENYNSFVRKHVDWNAVRAKYRPMINNTTSKDQLYQVLVEMVEPLGDAHVCVEGPRHNSFCGKRSGTRDETTISRHEATAAVDTHLRDALGITNIQTFADGKIAYADLPNGCGYLRITSFEDYGGDEWSAYPDGVAMATALDAIFTQAHVSAWRGLVIDVRWNDGGDDALALQVAGRLTNTPYVAYTKSGRG
ncbi:MAG: hypothetical protein J2P20_05025, partial [Pseudonocardia sp.]|nr:hypothetical protein [Pseudonocardia sp.]